MTQQDILVRILRPADGHCLTEADETTDITLRTLASEVVLADDADPASWREITADEAAAIRAAQVEALERLRDARQKN